MDPTRDRGRVSSGVHARSVGTLTSPSSQHPRAALRALLRALEARGIGASARAVAVALWTHADPAGRCWPSQLTLGALVGRCERTVRTAVRQLESAGVLLRDVPALRERRVRRRTTAYRFTLGAWRTPLSERTWRQAVKTRKPTPQVLDALASLGARADRILVADDAARIPA